jgi:hypothetical protein
MEISFPHRIEHHGNVICQRSRRVDSCYRFICLGITDDHVISLESPSYGKQMNLDIVYADESCCVPFLFERVAFAELSIFSLYSK